MAEEAKGGKNSPREAVRRARNRAALGSSALSVLWLFVLGVALMRGPLATQALAHFVQKVPAFVAVVIAIAAVAPSIASAPRALFGVAAVGIVGSVIALTGSLPRFSFDAWERVVSTTAAGIPWAALGIVVVVGVIGAAFAVALHGFLAARVRLAPRQLLAIAIAAGVLASVVPASASVFLATGTRLVPVGEPDELWAPAFDANACPPK